MSTARDIITRSLRLIGVLESGEAGDSPDVVDSLVTLNALLDAWPLSRLMILAGQELVVPLTDAYVYGVGPGQAIDTPRVASLPEGSFIRFQAIDTPLTQISQAEYASIYTKVVAGRPSYIFYEPGALNGSLTLYPTPQSGMELHLAVNLPFTEFADLDTSYDLPPGYLRALQYNLAVEMAPEFGREAPPTVKLTAINSIRQIKKANSSVPIFDMPGGVPGVRMGGGLGGGFFSYGPDVPFIPDPTPGVGTPLLFGTAPLMFGSSPLVF